MAALRLIHGDARAAATLSADGLPLADSQTRDFLAAAVRQWQWHGYGLRIFRWHRSFFGYCGLRRIDMAGAPAVELLYAVVPDLWGRGYAREMARATLDDGFGRCALSEIIGFTLTTNSRSRHVMEACGLAYRGEITHAGLPHALYGLNASDWRAAAQAAMPR